MDPNLPLKEIITQFLTSLGYIAIPYRQNVVGQLLIDARVNDVDGVYILDSGASTTVIDARQVDTLKLKLNADEATQTGGGLGAHGVENAPSYDNRIELGSFKLDDFVVAVMSLESAWHSLAQVGATDELFGIIGVDLLKRGNAIIDFSTMKLYLIQP